MVPILAQAATYELNKGLRVFHFMFCRLRSFSLFKTETDVFENSKTFNDDPNLKSKNQVKLAVVLQLVANIIPYLSNYWKIN